MTNEEILLKALASRTPIAEFQPQNNKQAYLAYLNGLNVGLPAPRTNEEMLLYNLCANGMGGGENKLAQLVDKSITEVTAADLNGVEEIGLSAFANCSDLVSVDIPGTVKVINSSAFSKCVKLERIVIPDGVEHIYSSVFDTCSALTSVNIPDSVTIIYDNAFSGCVKLNGIVLPSALKSIGNSAFNRCSSLASIVIPSTVTSVGYQSFSGCTSLKSITCLAETPPTIVSGSAFTNVPADCEIRVPTASVEAYKAANGWKGRADYIVGV